MSFPKAGYKKKCTSLANQRLSSAVTNIPKTDTIPSAEPITTRTRRTSCIPNEAGSAPWEKYTAKPPKTAAQTYPTQITIITLFDTKIIMLITKNKQAMDEAQQPSRRRGSNILYTIISQTNKKGIIIYYFHVTFEH